MKRIGGEYPMTVTSDSFDYLANLLSIYCRTNTEETLYAVSIGDLVQDARHIYDENGHRGRCLLISYI